MERYGREWADGLEPIDIERSALLYGLPGVDPYEPFCRLVDYYWNRNPNSTKQFDYAHPWSEKIIRECLALCVYPQIDGDESYTPISKYLSVSGCASSGKSTALAVFIIVMWALDPAHTISLATSTSLKEAKKRIWGEVCDYFSAASTLLPGKLVESQGYIRTVLTDADGKKRKMSERCGIHLIAGEKKKEREAVAKLIGMKNTRVFLAADELPELSHALVQACKENLSVNPFLLFVGLGNPASPLDPHGSISEPKEGWASIDPTMDEWETRLGKAIRFDAEKSPNVLAERAVYPYGPTREWIAQQKEDLGEDSLGYWRMVRAFWCPDGATEGVYSDSEILASGGMDRVSGWKTQTVRLGGCDPAFSNGGDRTVVYFAELGRDRDGERLLQYNEYHLILDDASDKDTPRAFQVARKIAALARKNGVEPKNFACDKTGTTSSFYDILCETWSGDVLGVDFGGGASSLIVGTAHPAPANERYYNRSSELWYVGKEFLRGGQLKGIGPDLAREMVNRRGEKRKTDKGALSKVEPKEAYRARTGRSPDIADAAFILLDLARVRHGFQPRLIGGVKKRLASVASANNRAMASAAPTEVMTGIGLLLDMDDGMPTHML